jgi:hypothetical protein
MRMVVSGANPTTPNLEDVLFDANQPPLRLMQKGRATNVHLATTGIPNWDGHVEPITALAVPKPGGFRIPNALGNRINVSGAPWESPYMNFDPHTGQAAGIGVAVSDDTIWAVNFWSSYPIDLVYMVLYNSILG